MIKYPDVISGTVIITTKNPPVKLISKSSGELDKLWSSDNSRIQKGQVIASINSTLDENAKIQLEGEIKLVKELFLRGKLETYDNNTNNLTYGELQSLYSSLQTALNNYKVLILQNSIAFTINNISKQISNQKALLRVLSKQKVNAHQLLNNAEARFNSDKQLYEKGVISQMEFFEREKAYHLSVNEINSLDKSKIQISIAITDLEKQLHDTKFKFNQDKQVLKKEIENNLLTIENALATWKQSYEVTAAISGKLTFLQSVHKRLFIEQGKSLFAIVPENQTFIAQLKIPKSGFGKVKIGQKVMIKLDNFPHYEYGQIRGKVVKIALISNEEMYAVDVKLVGGMQTTYKKQLKYSPEMSGTAEIITENLRITDRIFNKFRKIFE